MSDDLREALQDIDGIGPATADKVLETLADHGAGGVPGEVGEALAYLDAGRPGYAAKYLRRLVE